MALVSSTEALASLPKPVASALKRAGVSQNQVGIYVKEIGKRLPPLISLNAGKPMNPASVMKLLTTFTALNLLGPNHTWQTTFLANVPVSEYGDLMGNLYLRGGGDPFFLLENFWLLLAQLRSAGVKTIHGDLVIDRQLYDVLASDADAFFENGVRPYEVEPSALTLGFGVLRFLLTAQHNKVQVSLSPNLSNIQVVNRLRPAGGSCTGLNDRIQFKARPQISGSYQVILSGTYPNSCEKRFWYISSIPNIDFIRSVFETIWSDLGGQLTGIVRAGQTPLDATELTTVVSQPLSDIIKLTNKYSNNVMARLLLLNIGLEGSRQGDRGVSLPAFVTEQDGANQLKKYLIKQGLSMPELKIENGSGLSNTSRVSPESVGRLLEKAWMGPWQAEFSASLPIAGLDGTMSSRLKQSSQIRVKTGTLSSVKSIAGYVSTRSGKTYSVVFIANGVGAERTISAQDLLLNWVRALP